MLTTLVLGSVAIANLFTKQIATKYGVAFTIVLFLIVHDLGKDQPAPRADREEGAGAVQSGSSGAGRLDHAPRAARLRGGGRARFPPHGTPEAGARKDQPA